jgi:hypothetical protein
MLTLVTIPKPFRGHIGIIQHNAIASWSLLSPRPEIILFGDDEGTAQTANEFDVRHVSVARNEHGTPLLDDLFEKAQSLATNDLICYVNADILLMNDFMQAIEQVASQRTRFLMVGQRTDLEMKSPLDFGPGWEQPLLIRVREEGRLHPPAGSDYFVFPRGLVGRMPRFAVGRPGWDNWMIFHARSRKAIVIDATRVVTAVHQNHDFCKAGEKEAETRRNLELVGCFLLTIEDATHLLTPKGLKRALDRSHMWRLLADLPISYPHLRLPVRLLFRARRLWHKAGA